MFHLVFVFTCLFPCFHSFTIFSSEHAPTWLSRGIHQHTFSRLAGAQEIDCMTCLTSPQFVFINLQSFRPSVPPHGSAEQFTNKVLVAWLAHKFLIASSASPHKAQQSYQPHSTIGPILPSSLSPSKTPGTSFRLTSNTTLQFQASLK